MYVVISEFVAVAGAHRVAENDAGLDAQMSGRKAYDQEFKSEVARDLGVDPQTIRRWLHELALSPEQRSASTTNAAELARLKREVELLRQERDILKKGIGIFSRMPE